MTSHGSDLTVHVGGARPTTRQLAREVVDVAVALPLFIVAPFVRRWHQRWGATEAEIDAAMPGDELVPGCQYRCTRAITIDAPPAAVWPWLVQVGFGKAGFYSNDLLDNVGHPSADVILEESQHPAVGDWIPMFSKVNGTTAFKVAAIEPRSELVWFKPDSTWAWKLTELEGGKTRLVTRLRILYRWDKPLGAVASLVLNEVGDFPMMRKMLLTLKSRAESSGTSRRTMPVRYSVDDAAEVEAADSHDRRDKQLLGLRRQPGRMALAIFRLPLPLYRQRWGWLLGDTFLLMTHAGRKTGKRHSTAAMALAYDRETHETVICSVWGENTDWIRNIRVHPALLVQIGRASFTPEQRFLMEDESFAVAVEFRRRHPWRLRLLTWILGWGDLRSDVEVRDFIRTRPFVAFRPAQPSRL